MKKPDVAYIFFNGELVPYSNARVHIMSTAARYGANVFEGIRGYWNEDKKQMYLFRQRDHMERLLQSMKLNHFEGTYAIEDLERWTLEVVRKNELRESIHIRPCVFIDGEIGAVGAKGPLGIAISAIPMGKFLTEKAGATAMVSSWRRIGDDVMPARIKCGANYQNSRQALIEANQHGYDATILLDRNGKVTEEARACVFICRRGVPITPPVTYGILESITRETVLEIFSKEMEITPVEREIDRTELYIAEEAFFCGTGAEITPIVSIDGFGLPVGPLTAKVNELYMDIAKGLHDKYAEWLTPVY
jgi:branched-chain amino acid aminotransferase